MKYSSLLLFTFILMACSTKKNKSPMHPNASSHVILPIDSTHLTSVKSSLNSVYPVVVTRSIHQTKEFYLRWFGCEVVFESTWFILLRWPGPNENLIAFIDEVHPSSPPSPKAFSGDGGFYTLNVSNAQTLFDAFKKSKAAFAYPLTNEPWGQKRFAILDPNGLWIDIVEQTQPEEGWWDPYVLEK